MVLMSSSLVCVRSYLPVFTLSLLAAPMVAQGTGSLQGVVTDAESKDFLNGAIVAITSYGAAFMPGGAESAA